MARRTENLEYPPDADRFDDPADITPSAHIELTDNKELEEVLEPILLKIDTVQFVISLDNRPLFYVPNEAVAHAKMWSIARLLIKKRQEKDPNFQHYIKTTANELAITCLAKYIFVAYDSVAYRLRYDKVSECK